MLRFIACVVVLATCAAAMISGTATPLQAIPRLKGRNIYFLGMTGTGKSTIGRYYAPMINFSFADTDAIIEDSHGLSVGEIFASQGEDTFRGIESEVLRTVQSTMTHKVVATGGGIVLRESNRELLRNAITIHLDLPIEVVHDRLLRKPQEVRKRPLLQSSHLLSRLQHMYDIRKPLYSCADIHQRLTSDMSVHDCAMAIHTSLHTYFS